MNLNKLLNRHDLFRRDAYVVTSDGAKVATVQTQTFKRPCVVDGKVLKRGLGGRVSMWFFNLNNATKHKPLIVVKIPKYFPN